MDVIVLAAGGGTRLLPLTALRPKPLVPVCNQPILKMILQKISILSRRHRVDRIVILVDYLGQVIRDAFGSEFAGLPIEYVEGNLPFGTAGAVKRILPDVSDPFFCIHSDIVTGFPLERIVEFFEKKGGVAALSLAHMENTRSFGVVETDADSRVISFVEKPKVPTPTNTVNAGIYMFRKSAFDHVAVDEAAPVELDMARHQFPDMVSRGIEFHALSFEEYWNDVGTPMTYMDTTWALLSGKENGHEIGTVHVTSSAGAGPGFPGNMIGEKSNIHLSCRINNSIIWKGVTIGKDSVISDSIICDDVTIGEGTVIESGAVIGDRCHIGSNCRVPRDMRLWCGARIPDNTVLHGE